MQKLVPIEYGQYYHIYNRGINRENIFFEEQNYHYFLKLYVKHIVPIADTFAYCLMKNHFHFLIRIKAVEEQKQAQEVSGEQSFHGSKQTLQFSETDKVLNPTQQFSNMFNSYAKSINKAYKRTGSLFQKHFGRVLVDSDRYFVYLITYIHRNPQKHGFVDDFRTYPYSSYRAIRYQKSSRLNTDQVLAWFGDLDAFSHYHQTWTNENEIGHLIAEDFF